MNIEAVIVARKGSRRVKNKALQRIGDLTLLQIKIRQLRKAKNIDRVVVGSDSYEILDMAQQEGAQIVVRDKYYCDEDLCTANEMIFNMVSMLESDIVVWSHCTNPFIKTQTYEKSVNLFLEFKKYDSLLSVLKINEHMWDSNKNPLNYNPYANKHCLAKDCPPYYIQDGGIFIQTRENFLKNSYFFGKNPYLFEIDFSEFFDINTMDDLDIARALYSNKIRHTGV